MYFIALNAILFEAFHLNMCLFDGSSESGTKEEPLLAETINPVHIKQQAEMREKLAALKEKRLLNQKLG